ncbi:MAG: PilZ domain-containing protein [Myxococcota bacterium]
MTSCHPILLVSTPPRGQEMSARLQPLDVTPLLAADLAEAEAVLAKAGTPVAAALIDLALVDRNLKGCLKRLRRHAPTTGMTFVAFGAAPERATRKTLRSAGVSLGLWEPIDEGVLRFQINRALNGSREGHGRSSPRVPTFLVARVHGGGRTKDAVVYSLSETGAFLETPRASMDGAQVEIEMNLPGQALRLSGKVVFSNVPGNLQRPNLPLGMGVRFGEMSRDERKRIAEFVDDRAQQLNL